MIPIRLAATLGGAAALLLGAKLYLSGVEQRGYERCQAEHTAAALEAAQASARKQIRLIDNSSEVAREYAQVRQQLERERAARVAADSQLARVRILLDEASARDPGDAAADPGSDPDGERLAVVAEFLREGVGLLEEARGSVASLAAKTAALQAQISRVCLAK